MGKIDAEVRAAYLSGRKRTLLAELRAYWLEDGFILSLLVLPGRLVTLLPPDLRRYRARLKAALRRCNGRPPFLQFNLQTGKAQPYEGVTE